MGPKDGVPVPTPHGFVLPHLRSAPHDDENFLPHPRPMGPRKAPPHPTPSHKTLLFVNLPITIIIVFNKTYFVNKNILEITNKFITSIRF